jgi:hypothetical protein
VAWLDPGKRMIVAFQERSIVLDVVTGEQRELALPPIDSLVGDRKGRVLARSEGRVKAAHRSRGST